MTNKTDQINRPAHYIACKSGIECIEIVEQLPFCLGNCYKYLHRAGHKGDALTDLKKSYYYARRAYWRNEQLTDNASLLANKVAKHATEDKARLIHLFANAFGAHFLYHLETYIYNNERTDPADLVNQLT